MSDSSHVVDVSRSTEPVEEEPDERQVVDWLTQALTALECHPAEVSVRIVSEAEMAELNKRYRGKDKPTNVLSFPSGIEAEGHLFLGDIVVCNAVVFDEAIKFDKTFPDRFAHMVVHGLLHLLGHDHIEADDQKKMEAVELTLLAGMGVTDPYELSE